MLHAPTLREGTTAHVILDTMEMDSPATVNISVSFNTFITYLIDTDECEDGTSTCDKNADCVDVKGSFHCVCSHGYTGSGMNCTG